MRNALLPFFLFGSFTLQAQVPVMQQMLDEVHADSLVWRAQRLTGQVPVYVGNGPQTILSRNVYQPGNALAAAWMQQEFWRMGYAPAVQNFGSTGANILVEKPGLVHPERKVIICAHYDAMPGGTTAPGADDDGSGTCAVLEAARVMAAQDFENTVVFALWDNEEQGMVGSAYYANSAFGNDEQIIAVVNMDAIGYDGNGDGLMRIHTRPIGNSMAIKDSALMVNGTYGLDLPIAINNPGETYSDHASFWDEGYGAILVIEDFDDDPNPHYHTASDRLEFMDTTYWQGLARLAIGTAAVMAVPFASSGLNEVDLASHGISMELFPNPARQRVFVRLRGMGEGRITVTMLDATGRAVRTVHHGEGATKARSLQLDLGGLAPGLLSIRASSGNAAVVERLVLLP